MLFPSRDGYEVFAVEKCHRPMCRTDGELDDRGQLIAGLEMAGGDVVLAGPGRCSDMARVASWGLGSGCA
jgi:hypothetical protein